MKLTMIATTALIALSATAASADQLAKAAGVPSGVYADTTLVALIDARENNEAAKVNFLLGNGTDTVRVSSRGDSVDFDRLITSAEQDGDTGRVASLTSLANGDNFNSGVDFARLIDQAEQDGEYGKVAALKSQAGL